MKRTLYNRNVQFNWDADISGFSEESSDSDPEDNVINSKRSAVYAFARNNLTSRMNIERDDTSSEDDVQKQICNENLSKVDTKPMVWEDADEAKASITNIDRVRAAFKGKEPTQLCEKGTMKSLEHYLYDGRLEQLQDITTIDKCDQSVKNKKDLQKFEDDDLDLVFDQIQSKYFSDTDLPEENIETSRTYNIENTNMDTIDEETNIEDDNDEDNNNGGYNDKDNNNAVNSNEDHNNAVYSKEDCNIEDNYTEATNDESENGYDSKELFSDNDVDPHEVDSARTVTATIHNEYDNEKHSDSVEGQDINLEVCKSKISEITNTENDDANRNCDNNYEVDSNNYNGGGGDNIRVIESKILYNTKNVDPVEKAIANVIIETTTKSNLKKINYSMDIIGDGRSNICQRNNQCIAKRKSSVSSNNISNKTSSTHLIPAKSNCIAKRPKTSNNVIGPSVDVNSRNMFGNTYFPFTPYNSRKTFTDYNRRAQFDSNLRNAEMGSEYNDSESEYSYDRSSSPQYTFNSYESKTSDDKNKRVKKEKNRKSFSFTNERIREIERDNRILLRKILSQKSTYVPPKLNKKKHPETKYVNLPSTTKLATSALNRKRQQRQIDLDNQVLKRKIEAIAYRKPVSQIIQ